MVRKLSVGAHILCFQEVHGKDCEIPEHFGSSLPSWRIRWSTPRSGDDLQMHTSGGVVIVVAPHLALMDNFEDRLIIPGRCIGISVLGWDKFLSVINLHNYGLLASQVNAIGNFMSSLVYRIRVSPHLQAG